MFIIFNSLFELTFEVRKIWGWKLEKILVVFEREFAPCFSHLITCLLLRFLGAPPSSYLKDEVLPQFCSHFCHNDGEFCISCVSNFDFSKRFKLCFCFIDLKVTSLNETIITWGDWCIFKAAGLHVDPTRNHVYFISNKNHPTESNLYVFNSHFCFVAGSVNFFLLLRPVVIIFSFVIYCCPFFSSSSSIWLLSFRSFTFLEKNMDLFPETFFSY